MFFSVFLGTLSLVLLLAESDHVTGILASDWLSRPRRTQAAGASHPVARIGPINISETKTLTRREKLQQIGQKLRVKMRECV